MPPSLRDLVRDAIDGLRAAVAHVAALQQVVRVETLATPAGPALDLAARDRSGPARASPHPSAANGRSAACERPRAHPWPGLGPATPDAAPPGRLRRNAPTLLPVP